METETPKATPILEIAWMRHANLSTAASRRTKAFYRIRRWIIVLGVVATLFALITQWLVNINAPALLKLLFKWLLIATPAIASGLAWFSTRHYTNGAWLIFRAGSEEIKKEIYFYRTILKNSKDRRAYLEKRLNGIQRQLFRSLSGEFAFEGYNGPLPMGHNPQDPDSDPGFNDLTGDEYFKFRVVEQLDWHNKRVLQRRSERHRMTIFIAASGIVGTILAAVGGGLALWVALTASITAALVSWQELRNLDAIIKNYSKVVMELTILYDHWMNLEPEERTNVEFYKMVRSCEEVLWAQNTEYIRSMQEALQDANLEQEASLINRVIKESVESADRTKQAMADAMVEQTRKTLVESEEQIVETFKETLGTLAEEASSELVQKELEAMSKAAAEFVENAVEKVSHLTSSLADIAKEFAHVDIGRDTTKEQLNAILARYPKTNNVKG